MKKILACVKYAIALVFSFLGYTAEKSETASRHVHNFNFVRRLYLSKHYLVALLLVGGMNTTLFAQEHRQYGTHEHGVGRLNFAQEGTEVHLEFESPAANIVGYEHIPSSEVDYDNLAVAIATLNEGERLFHFSAGAGCNLLDAIVETSLINHKLTQKPKEKEKANKEAHEEKQAHKNDNDNHEHNIGGEKDEDYEDTHADITASYRFICNYPEALKQMNVVLFGVFPATKRLQMQFASSTKQAASVLTATNTVFKF